MEEVFRILAGKTDVWASRHTLDAIEKDLTKNEHFALVKKMTGCASNGFASLPDNIIRHEGAQGGGETWRFAYKNSTLYRVVGFFTTTSKREFVALDAFYKHSDKDYSKAQWNRMKEISETKLLGENVAWKRATT